MYWFHLQKKIIANFHVLGFLIHKKQVKSQKNSVCHAALPTLPSRRWSKFVSTIISRLKGYRFEISATLRQLGWIDDLILSILKF
jgi:hypothetical protein